MITEALADLQPLLAGRPTSAGISYGVRRNTPHVCAVRIHDVDLIRSQHVSPAVEYDLSPIQRPGGVTVGDIVSGQLLYVGPIGVHYIQFVISVPVGGEQNLCTVGRIGGSCLV